MTDLDPAWLRSFAAIARAGSVTRAAQQVHRTQSAVSTHLQHLEAAVGARLVPIRVDTEGLVVAGMMTSMCVDATVRAAADLGFTITLAHDACAAPDLAHGGVEVPGAMVHAAFVAALGDGYATVAGVGELV